MGNKIFNICFIGGLTNGKVVVDFFESNKFVDLGLIITYPDNVKKPRFVTFPDNNKTIKDISANKYFDIIKEYQPDFIFVAGWSELLKKELLSIPKYGTIGFHPAKLPMNRGRSVIAWQIEEGYTETALTMFYLNELPDCGDIIAQEIIKIEENDYVNDILDKLDKATYNLLSAYFPLLTKSIAPKKKQDCSSGNFRRLRQDNDLQINWNRNSKEIYNKIRAVSFPYPGAIGIINGKKYKIWKAEIVNFDFGDSLQSGDLVATLYDNSLIVKTKDGFLLCTEYTGIK